MDGSNNLIGEAIVMLSDDLDYEHHAVHHFMEVTISHLKNQWCLNITKIHEWSNGCSTQYKGKRPFVDLSYAVGDFSLSRVKNYYMAASMGKGRVMEFVKSVLESAILGERVVVRNAKEVYDYSKAELSGEFHS